MVCGGLVHKPDLIKLLCCLKSDTRLCPKTEIKFMKHIYILYFDPHIIG